MTVRESASQTPQGRRGEPWLQDLGEMAGLVVFVVIGVAAIFVWRTVDWYFSACSDGINPVCAGKNKCIGSTHQKAEGVGHSSRVLAQRRSMAVMLDA